MRHLVVVGGGAAGFFAAVNVAEMAGKAIKITILEKGRQWLGKVKISGGGRCNVTNALTDPKEIAKNYPRGGRELLGALHSFGTSETVRWFQERGVILKTEPDGRIFPITDSSQTIIDCLMNLAIKHKIELCEGEGLVSLIQKENLWEINTAEKRTILADMVLMASGSSNTTWEILENVGCKIIPPVPSLFTFNIKDPRINGLLGIAVPLAKASIESSKLNQTGPLLITHWGMSGPSILRLSAWGANELFDKGYKFNLKVNWTGLANQEKAFEALLEIKKELSAKKVTTHAQFGLPNRLWHSLLINTGIVQEETRWSDFPNAKMRQLAEQLTAGSYQVVGKSTFKDEFVTAGGIALDEINFKTMESKKFPHLYFAGEVLNIDGITGGFNFQAAWTTGWLAAKSISEKV